MFKNLLIFFSTLFFFFSSSFEVNSLTKDKVLKIKQKVNVVNSIVSKTRIHKSKLNLGKYKKSKNVFEAIKKSCGRKWSQIDLCRCTRWYSKVISNKCGIDIGQDHR